MADNNAKGKICPPPKPKGIKKQPLIPEIIAIINAKDQFGERTAKANNIIAKTKIIRKAKISIETFLQFVSNTT